MKPVVLLIILFLGINRTSTCQDTAKNKVNSTNKPEILIDDSFFDLIDEIEDDEGKISDDEIYVIVEQMPKFSNGKAGFVEYLRKNIKISKDTLARAAADRVFIEFVVDRTGKVDNIVVVHSAGKEIDSEIIKVFLKSPRWKPGYQFGKPVNVRFTIPIWVKDKIEIYDIF